MQKGELLTVELFLSSKSVDSGTCATLWSQVAANFPEELMRVSLSYTGGGITKDKVRTASSHTAARTSYSGSADAVRSERRRLDAREARASAKATRPRCAYRST
jgi:effector-binding domain-containing protein